MNVGTFTQFLPTCVIQKSGTIGNISHKPLVCLITGNMIVTGHYTESSRFKLILINEAHPLLSNFAQYKSRS